MSLAQVQSDDRVLNMFQANVAAALIPTFNNPLINGRMITGKVLASGSNIINHGLGRDLQGWFIVGINGAAVIYDTQATNANPSLTLLLTSNATVTVNLFVF